MGKITVETCEIEGLKVITPTVFGDDRGYFMETYNYNDFAAAGIDVKFVQDNQSASKKGVLRGLHFQINFPQDKLVRVIKGEVYDVAVDLRKGSPTFGKYHGVILSEENKKQFFIPKNFAHGFVVLSDYAEFAYNTSGYAGDKIKDRKYRRELNKKVLEWDRKHPERISPIWACYHGIKSFEGKPQLHSERKIKRIRKMHSKL